jgi:predicted amino acid-binding ACT domain protein
MKRYRYEYQVQNVAPLFPMHMMVDADSEKEAIDQVKEKINDKWAGIIGLGKKVTIYASQVITFQTYKNVVNTK